MKLTHVNRKAQIRTAKAISKPSQPTPEQGLDVAGDQVTISPAKAPRSITLSAASLADDAAQTSVNVATAAVPGPLAEPIARSFQSGFVKGYLTPAQIRERCQKLQKEFPDLVEIIDTGIKTHGYDGKNKEIQGPSELFYMRIGPQTENRDEKVGIFQYAAPHARERVNPMTMMELTEQLVRNYDPESTDPKVQENTKLMDDLDIFVAINTNPDGHNYAIYDDPMWRKNRAPVGDGQVGVDINRNHPFEWEKSDDYDSQVYSGTGPASEAETQALLQVTQNHKNIMFNVDWHSYGEEIRRPLGVSEGDDKFYDEMHGRVQKAMQQVAGNKYDVVVSQVTKGTSDDHFYQAENIYSTVMETGKAFIPEESEAVVVMKESVEGAREFLRVASEFD